tara:strand:+ start:405 stop:1049 length:645 start_codon:yes stop_codon:yes gene_type:complete
MSDFNFYNSYFKPNPGIKKIVPDPVYNPNNAPFISSGTKLARGVSIGKFLGGVGEKTNMNHVTDDAERLQIARQLYLQAMAMNTVNTDLGQFSEKRLIVVEGLYKKGPEENLASGGLNDLATKGRVVVYQLLNRAGIPDHMAMFDLAVYWKDSILYEKVILDYDRYNPDGSLECHVILQMPKVDSNYKGNFTKQLETRFNGSVQTTGELIEILG